MRSAVYRPGSGAPDPPSGLPTRPRRPGDRTLAPRWHRSCSSATTRSRHSGSLPPRSPMRGRRHASGMRSEDEPAPPLDECRGHRRIRQQLQRRARRRAAVHRSSCRDVTLEAGHAGCRCSACASARSFSRGRSAARSARRPSARSGSSRSVPRPTPPRTRCSSHYGDGDHVFQWHMDTYDLPTARSCSSREIDVRNQAFRIGRPAWGVQFHFEVDADEIDLWLEEFAKEGDSWRSWGKTPEDVRREAERFMREHERKGAEVFRRFAAVARGSRPSTPPDADDPPRDVRPLVAVVAYHLDADRVARWPRRRVRRARSPTSSGCAPPGRARRSSRPERPAPPRTCSSRSTGSCSSAAATSTPALYGGSDPTNAHTYGVESDRDELRDRARPHGRPRSASPRSASVAGCRC